MATTDVMKTLLAQTVEAANYAAAQAAAAARSAEMITGLAPLASPVFTGNPTAPTPTLGDASASIATTEFIARLLGAASGIATLGADGKLTASQLPPISVTSVDTVASQAAMLALTGISVGAIAIRTDIGNAEFILTTLPASTLANWTEIGTSPVLSVAGLTGAIVATDLLTALAAAPLASPSLTGTPLAPTATAGTSTTQIATTAFVAASFAPLASPSLAGTPLAPTAVIDTNTGQISTCAFVLGQGSQVADGLPSMDGAAARGTATRFARADHIHPTDTTLAPLANPIFTGVPQAPTQAVGDNSLKLATTAYADRAAINATTGLAPLASPTFTGAPAAPTPSTADNTTKLATTAYVKSNIAALSFAPVPASSALPVGWSGLVVPTTGTTVPAGGTVAGSLVASAVSTTSSGTITSSGVTQTGTWRNDAGVSVGNSSTYSSGLFTRIA